VTVQRKLRATDTFRFLLLRRIRAPLIVLIVSFSISVLGFVLIPGIDADGNTWHMDFFHAYYFTSYMATTIGFGEIPYPFTDTQRLWTIISIYLTVGAWLYGFGTIISLLQDNTFKEVLKDAALSRHIRKIREPFYIICGYGDAGSLLLYSLTECGHHAVVLDSDHEKINALMLENHSIHVPGMAVDAGNSEQLNRAGLQHPMCAGVAAITGDDQVNLRIAITVKLLNPELEVVCRAQTQGVADNMNSFGTDCIVTPFKNYAELLSIAIDSPVKSQLYEWLYGTPRTALAAKMEPPSGYWVICGYSRMGKEIYQQMTKAGLECKVIVRRTELAPADTIAGRGTEAHTLEKADISRAVGIIAATNDDTDNLSIIMTARDLNPALFLVIRQNHYTNETLFAAANVDFIMHNNSMIAKECMSFFTSPQLTPFMQHLDQQSNVFAEQLLQRIQAVSGDETPDCWIVDINEKYALAACRILREGRQLTATHLLDHCMQYNQEVPLMILSITRGGKEYFLPDDDFELTEDDKLLLCGQDKFNRQIQFLLSDYDLLNDSIRNVLLNNKNALLQQSSA